ncbi:MAG: 4Fe-4S ferredoxin [Chloroflexi bacterium]|nr:4Fe-4S ferredoxin [Chloroflexota bacterium]
MSEEIYRKLAQRLDAIPNGFPPTESGVEVRLLEKIFTPEEAEIASVMRLTHEPAADIAARLGLDPKKAYRTLKKMTRKGQIRVEKGEGALGFGLMPFAVGFYEEQLPRLDEEMASLVEQYFQEIGGGSIAQSIPAVHRVIPVEEAIPFDLEIFPYERATAMLEEAKAWAVRDCICRVQRGLIGKACDHPVESCLVFAEVEGVFDHSKLDRALTKEEALSILRETEKSGLVHSTGNYRDGHHYICNCCTCCCGVLRGVAEFGVPTAVAHSDFGAVVNVEECIGCKDCVERCQFGALAVPEDVCEVDSVRCVGCGVCTMVCPTDALSLKRRPKGETPPLPTNNDEWLDLRAKERGIELADML